MKCGARTRRRRRVLFHPMAGPSPHIDELDSARPGQTAFAVALFPKFIMGCSTFSLWAGGGSPSLVSCSVTLQTTNRAPSSARLPAVPRIEMGKGAAARRVRVRRGAGTTPKRREGELGRPPPPPPPTTTTSDMAKKRRGKVGRPRCRQTTRGEVFFYVGCGAVASRAAASLGRGKKSK
jgi:hypothetical protein